MYLNTPAPEESISSFAIRRMLTSGEIEKRYIIKSIFSSTTENFWRLTPIASPQIERLINFTEDKYCLKSMCAQHTLNPLFSAVNESTLNTYNFMNFDNQKRTIKSFDIRSSIMRFCPLCFKEQIFEYGFCWFKREWLIPGMVTCQNHSCDLNIASCNNCELKNPLDIAISTLRGSCIKCNNHLWNVRFDNEKNEYSFWLKNLFNNDVIYLFGALRYFILIEAYSRLKNCTDIFNTKVIRPRLVNYFNDLYSSHYRKYVIERKLNYYPNEAPFCGRQHTTFSAQLSINLHSRDAIPLNCFFFPIYLAFPQFDEFISFLEDISSPFSELIPFNVGRETRILRDDIFRRFDFNENCNIAFSKYKLLLP